MATLQGLATAATVRMRAGAVKMPGQRDFASALECGAPSVLVPPGFDPTKSWKALPG